ncbi:oxidoreductase [Primorskyibacter flagellatus]|uniref:Oxidoreductase n=1 Tax=Primorskyibacter flagellatus TaxID=1387277 RepID=A0A917ADA5_9RHOB|nr:FAD-dependent oxidoreductase [Primorskyibacter flagellatus]GGE44503.1 oxidoreductase [Primorskyibacter flagellatus]
MKHIYADYAYTRDPIAACHWAGAVPDSALECPSAKGTIRTDTVIVGAGFTGLNAALHLAEDGVDVTLLDAQFPAFGASGRNGGFCCLGGTRATDAELDRRGGAKEVRRAERAAIDHVSALLSRLEIDADRQDHGESIVAHSLAMARHLPAMAEEMGRDYDTEPTVINGADMAAHGMAGHWHGALSVPLGFSLHPRKYAIGLLRAAVSAGAKVHGLSPALRIDHSTRIRVTTPDAVVEADRLILATNGYTAEDIPAWIRGRTLPAQSSVLATRPLTPEELAAQGWTTHQMAYEDRRLLHYFHLTPDNVMVFGQRGGLIASVGNDTRALTRMKHDFARAFPHWAHVGTPSHWSGFVCLTASLTPYCGPIPTIPGAFAAFGYHGNGVAMGSYLGMLLADLSQGKPLRAPLPEAFRREPPRFPLGPLRRAWLAAEYGWARLTDRAA